MTRRRLPVRALVVAVAACAVALLAPGSALAAPPRAATCPTAGYGVHYTAPGRGRTVALTFDDGPGVTTGAILRILEHDGVAATFFNIGVNERARPTTLISEAAQHFLLGNHTWSHPQLTKLSPSAQAAQMDREIAEQRSIIGSAPCLFRPPYGSYDRTTLQLAQARHMSVWNWSVDTEDWKARGSASSFWVKRIISRAEAGRTQAHPVVLMHNPADGNPATVAALPTIIRFYRSLGYTFVDLDGRVRRS